MFAPKIEKSLFGLGAICLILACNLVVPIEVYSSEGVAELAIVNGTGVRLGCRFSTRYDA